MREKRGTAAQALQRAVPGVVHHLRSRPVKKADAALNSMLLVKS